MYDRCIFLSEEDGAMQSLSCKKIIRSLLSAVIVSAVMFSMCSCKKDTQVCQEEALKLTVIMYHGLTDKHSRQNQYMISPDSFEDDLKFLKENGYHTISVSELILHFKDKRPLPEKPVLITYDDGYLNNYTFAFPLLKKYNAKALISPIGISADEAEKEKYRSADWSQCRWSELMEMCNSGLVELGNHTYDLHKTGGGKNGAAKMYGEDEQEYEKRLKEDVITANEAIIKHTGKTPQAFVYPFGAKSGSTEEIIRSLGFSAIFDCENKMNILTSQDDLYHLHRFIRAEKTVRRICSENE